GRWSRCVGADDGAPHCQWLTARRQLLNPTVAGIADVDVSARVNSDARRQLERPRVDAFPADLSDWLTRRRQHLHALVGRISHVHLPLLVQGYVRRRPELTWRRPARPPLRDWLSTGRQDL